MPGIGDPRAPAPDSPCYPAATWGVRTGRPSAPPATSKAPCTKMLGPTLPLATTLTSARPSDHRTAGRLGLLGVTLNIGRPLTGPPKGPGAATPGIGDPRAPAPDSPCRPATTWATRGTARYSGRETGRALRTPSVLLRPPHQNAWAHTPAGQRPHLGPTLRSQHSRRIWPADLLGANPIPTSAREGPLPRGLAPQPRG